jgi:hypothetical protein
MATAVSRGFAIINAIVNGTPTNISAWASIAVQSTGITQKWDQENIKDSNGFTCSRQARDASFDKKIMFKPTAQTLALARSATVVLAPFAELDFAGEDATDLDGGWQLQSGAEIQIKNDASADYSLSVERFADSTQNALILSTPS